VWIFKVLDKEITIKNMLLLSLLMVFICNVMGYLLFGPAPLYDATTMLIAVATCALLAFVLIKSDDALLPMTAMLTIFFLLFIFSRVLAFLYFPDRSHLPLSVSLGVKEINLGFSYFALGAAALNAGFFLARKLFANANSKVRDKTNLAMAYSSRHLLIAFLIVCVIQLYVAVWLGDSVLGEVDYGVRHKWVGVLSVLFNNYLAMLVIVVSLLISRRRGRRITVSLPLFIGAFVCVTVLLGSRSGGMTVLVLVLCAMLALHGNFKESLKSYLYFLLAVAVLSAVSFKVGTGIRTEMIYARDHSVAPGNEQTEVASETEAAEEAHDKPAIGGVSALSRLGAAFDTEVLTLSLHADHEMLSSNMTLSYALKSAVNVIVPGVIFADAQTNTALLWPFVYKLRDKALLQKGYYESFLWTAWGVAYAMFGWAAGIMALLISGVILQALFMLTCKFGEVQPYFSTMFLLNVFSFYSSMGLDDWLVGLQRTFFSLCLVLLILWAIAESGRWYMGRKVIER
jgi:hypothetical protein